MKKENNNALRIGFETACIDKNSSSDPSYKPGFISNEPKKGRKVLSSVEDELMSCEHFRISVAFITMNGIVSLLQTLKELEQNGIKGEILTTNYLNFSEPRALEKLNGLKNITLKMYDVHQNLEVGDMVQERVIRRDTNMSALVGKEKS